MKKLILVSLLTFASLSAFSQQDSQAQQLLNEVTKKVRSYNNILIEFKYFMINPEKSIKQETRGDVTLEGNKYVLNMMGPTRIFDGNKIYTIVPADEEVPISTYTADNDAEITPNKMLTFYEKGYNAQMDIQQNVKGRKIQYIKLTPTDSKSTVKNVLLGIDAQTKHIYKMIQSNKEGMQFTVTINSFKTNQPLSKTLFTFDEDRYRNNGYYINKL